MKRKIVGITVGTPYNPRRIGEQLENGKSAYELAVEHGFEGSEVEWLESLHGNDGQPGADGKDGAPGKDGVDGQPGKDAEVDATLTQQGMAADAKATGDAIGKLSEEKADKKDIPAPYILPAASADTLGGVKVSDDFVMDGETLKAKPENEYELIEKVVVGYRLLVERPEDWETNWSGYYENTSLEKAVVPLDGARVWEPYKYYADDGDASIREVVRTTYPDGTPYHFSDVVAKMRFESGTYADVNVRMQGGVQIATFANAVATSVRWAAARFEIAHGYASVQSTDVVSYYYSVTRLSSSAVPRFVAKCDVISQITVVTIQDVPMPKGSIFEIWGVRAK